MPRRFSNWYSLCAKSPISRICPRARYIYAVTGTIRSAVPFCIWEASFVHGCFSAFCEEKACFSHTYHYTFLERCKLPRPIAWIAARASAFFGPKMVRSLRAIAVYRNGAKSMLTLRESIKALLAGESILLFPDVDYTSENGGVESLQGFCCWNACIAQRRGSIFRLCPLW